MEAKTTNNKVMSEEAIKIYKSHESPPDWAIKEIQAGRLKGKSDINPQWRILALTQAFGLVGFGWKYTIDKKEIIDGANGEKVAFADISLYVKQGDQWSDAILGTGGSSFVANEKSGPFTSDEAYKMAITDAISVACKQLGIGAAVYSGSKYDAKTKVEAQPMTESQKQELIKFSSLTEILTQDQRTKIVEWVSKPQTFEAAQKTIEHYTSIINAKLQPTS
jgi:hypothetical protein